MWETITAQAATESPLWGEALRPEEEQERTPVFSPLGPSRHAVGLETIYEGMLTYRSEELFADLRRNGMRDDFSWDRSAAEYEHLFVEILHRVRR